MKPLKFRATHTLMFEDHLQTVWHLFVEATTGYAFWTLFHGYVPVIWFYPLNELSITGYEAFAASLLVPSGLTLLIGRLRSSMLLSKPLVIAVLRLVIAGTLSGSFTLAHPFNLARLIIMSIGLVASLLLLQASIWNESTYRRCVMSLGLTIGYFVLVVSRIFYVSVIPAWADFTSNLVISSIMFSIAVIQIVFGLDPIRPPSVISDHHAFVDFGRNDGPWFRVGVGFGSYLYLTHSFFSEVSVLARWFELACPYISGAIVLAAMILGLIFVEQMPKIATSPIWWCLCGFLPIMAMFIYPYYAFVGVVCLPVYVFSVWPRFWLLLAKQAPGHVMAVAIITYVFEMIFSIWTVAYNFVPGGQLTREQTPSLMAFVITSIGFAHLVVAQQTKQEDIDCSRFTPNFEVVLPKSTVLVVKAVFLFLLLSGVSNFALRSNLHHSRLSTTKPHRSTSAVDFNAAVWTFHFGCNNFGWPSLEKSAVLLRDTHADVIALLETDASRPFLGNIDIAMWLSDRLDMHVDFGPPTRHHTWGSLLLSRYPFLTSRHHLLPSPHGELAPAVSATVNISGHLVDFVAAHMGNHRDKLDRQLQSKYLASLVNESTNPVVFLGYVTSNPRSIEYRRLIETGCLKDIDSDDNDRFCEYIMYRDLIRLGYARLSRGTLSDTELQMAKFRIPKNGKHADNERRERFRSNVPEEQLFTLKFGTYFAGEYRGDDNHYHMNTPKYFLPA